MKHVEEVLASCPIIDNIYGELPQEMFDETLIDRDMENTWIFDIKYQLKILYQ